MPRIIVFLLTIAALAILALQNLATEVPLVVLSRTFSDGMPLGLLLLVSVGIGAVLTLIFYGLVGSRRPPESKYKPMGRRVPYPEGPSSSRPLPASGPSGDSSFSPPASKRYSSSSAFVSEPAGEPTSTPASEPKTSPQPFVTPPQDQPVQDTPPSSAQATYPQNFASRATSAQVSSEDDFVEPPNTYFKSGDSDYGAQASNSAQDSTRSDDLTRTDNLSTSGASSTFIRQPIAGLKSAFGKKKDRKNESDEPEKPIGDDWGQRRTKEQINSWDASVGEPSKLEEGAKSLFNFGRNVGANAGRLAEDIASGWTNQPADNKTNGSANAGAADVRSADARYDGLDQGWENFDDYGDPPPPGGIPATRTYGDSLYGNDDGLDSGYVDETYADDMGPDGVYDADYKVIVPPSKPLVDTDDGSDDYA